MSRSCGEQLPKLLNCFFFFLIKKESNLRICVNLFVVKKGKSKVNLKYVCVSIRRDIS